MQLTQETETANDLDQAIQAHKLKHQTNLNIVNKSAPKK